MASNIFVPFLRIYEKHKNFEKNFLGKRRIEIGGKRFISSSSSNGTWWWVWQIFFNVHLSLGELLMDSSIFFFLSSWMMEAGRSGCEVVASPTHPWANNSPNSNKNKISFDGLLYIFCWKIGNLIKASQVKDGWHSLQIIVPACRLGDIGSHNFFWEWKAYSHNPKYGSSLLWCGSITGTYVLF